ncbi:ATP-binding protein, partial [bacterium]|nr:ATP-binding protein [bacterium]
MLKNITNPFSLEYMNEIFKIDPNNNNRLISRESSHVEFKESWNWGSKSKYVKTMASFANAEGGYLVFGIKDKPREIIGLQNDKFNSFGEHVIEIFLQKTFSHQILLQRNIFQIVLKTIGLIYVFPARNKPIICTISDSELKEGEIYYRYRGRSEKIRYPELRNIIEEEKEKERNLWLDKLSKIKEIGIQNVGILNKIDGQLYGQTEKYLIDKDLLNQINFIESGKFSETDGDPTLRIIGEVKSIDSKKLQPIQYVNKQLHTQDI